MTVPDKYRHNSAPVKYFLSSYRALSDGRNGIVLLEKQIETAKFALYEWKVTWIGTCTIIRSSIDLFQIDAKSCLHPRICEEIIKEWHDIRKNRDKNRIFWDFLRQERNSILHEYEWRAYEAWMKPDGTLRPARLSLLMIDDDGARPALLMRDGPFKGRNSLELLKESADWAESRIFSAIKRAGFDPNESRNFVDFMPLPNLRPSLLEPPEGG